MCRERGVGVGVGVSRGCLTSPLTCVDKKLMSVYFPRMEGVGGGGGYQGDTGPARPKHFMKRTTLMMQKLDKECLQDGRLLTVTRRSVWTEKGLSEGAILSTGSRLPFAYYAVLKQGLWSCLTFHTVCVFFS